MLGVAWYQCSHRRKQKQGLEGRNVLYSQVRGGGEDGHRTPCKATGEASGLGQEAEHRSERGAEATDFVGVSTLLSESSLGLAHWNNSDRLWAIGVVSSWLG